MATTPDYPAIGPITGTELLLVWQNGAQKQAVLSSLGQAALAGFGDAVTSAATSGIATINTARDQAEAAITTATTSLNGLVTTAQSAATTATNKAAEASAARDQAQPTTRTPYPDYGIETTRLPELQQDGNLRSWVTFDGRARTARRAATEGIDFDVGAAPFVETNGNITVIQPNGQTAAGPVATPNWSGGAALRYQPVGLASGVPVITFNRPLIGSATEAMMGRDGMLALAHDPDLCHILIADGQSLSTGTNGKFFDANTLFATPSAMLPNVCMPMRNAGQSDVRMGRQADWSGTKADTAIDPASIVGFMPAGPRLLQEGPWNSGGAVFGETILERAAKVYSDAVFAVTKRRPMVLILTLGYGGIAIDNLLSTGANMPGTSTTKRANDDLVLARIAALLAAQGKRGVVVGVLRKHGETSSADAAYQAKATQHITETNASIRTAFAQQFNPPWIEHVTSAIANDATQATNFHASCRAIAAMHAAGTLHIAGADYAFIGRQAYAVTGIATPPNPDYVHKTARGYALAGEAMARQLLSVLGFNRRNRGALRLTGVTRVSATVYDLAFSNDDGAVAIELDGAPGFTAPANAGVTYFDTQASPPAISSVAVNSGALRVTMASSIDGRTGRYFAVAENGPSSGSTFSGNNNQRSTVRDPTPLYTSEVDSSAVYARAVPMNLGF